ncbi:DUF4956 domain-containing protein [Bacteroidota bacterium]
MIEFLQQSMEAISPVLLQVDDANAVRFLGIKIINSLDFLELVIRFVFNMTISIIIVRYLYYAVAKRKDYLFTYILISATVFLLCYLLENVKLELGFALGLFAIFGIIRYRTSQIPIKEMTYLFIVIGLAVINALANKKVSYVELVFTNLIIVGIVWGLEKIWLLKHESSKRITYEKIDLIKPEKYNELLADVEKRTGLKVNRLEVGSVNFLRDTANVKVYYFASENRVNAADEENSDTRTDSDPNQ